MVYKDYFSIVEYYKEVYICKELFKFKNLM